MSSVIYNDRNSFHYTRVLCIDDLYQLFILRIPRSVLERFPQFQGVGIEWFHCVSIHIIHDFFSSVGP